MKIIAFKRAGSEQSGLHPEFITEWINADLLSSTEGYETMLQEHFDLELAKNPERHEAHLKHLDNLEKAKLEAQKAADHAWTAEEKKLNREFEEFKRWKLNKGKK